MNIDAPCHCYLYVIDRTHPLIGIVLPGYYSPDIKQPLLTTLYNYDSIWQKLQGLSLHYFAQKMIESKIESFPRTAEINRTFLRTFYGHDCNPELSELIIKSIANRKSVTKKDIEKIKLSEALK